MKDGDMERTKEQDARPVGADEEGWFVKIRPAQVRVLYGLGLALLLLGVVACWLLHRVGDRVGHLADVMEVTPRPGGK